MRIGVQRVTAVLGGWEVFGDSVRTPSELRRAVEAGLPVLALVAAARYVAGDERGAVELRDRLVSRTTLRRRVRLTAEESERVERLARMMALAEEVWGDADLAREFLASPHPQLDGERPVDRFRSDLGTREVEELLFRMEFALPV